MSSLACGQGLVRDTPNPTREQHPKTQTTRGPIGVHVLPISRDIIESGPPDSYRTIRLVDGDVLAQPKHGFATKSQYVGLAGFEPTTSSSRTKRATKLRHSPLGSRFPRSQADKVSEFSRTRLRFRRLRKLHPRQPRPAQARRPVRLRTPRRPQASKGPHGAVATHRAA